MSWTVQDRWELPFGDGIVAVLQNDNGEKCDISYSPDDISPLYAHGDIEGKQVYLTDPTCKKRQLSEEELAEIRSAVQEYELEHQQSR